MIEVKIGERYEHLTVLCDAGVVIKNNGKRYRVVSCKCDCGNVCQKTLYGLRSGKSKRCKKCSTSIETINELQKNTGYSFTKHTPYFTGRGHLSKEHKSAIQRGVSAASKRKNKVTTTPLPPKKP